MRLSDLLAAFKGCDKVIFKLTGCGEQECETAEFKGAIDTIEALQAENEQLRAQVARTKGNLCLLCVGCEAEPENGTIECNSFVCRNKARCHNPNDVEALRKAREALIDYKTFLESFQCTCEPSNEIYPGAYCERCCRLDQAKQALAAIDKAIGG